MSCQRCSSDRILNISGKCSDLCGYSMNGHESPDYSYVPKDMGVGGGDDLSVVVCLDCGQLQGTWPLPKTEFESEIEEQENDPFKNGDFVEFDQQGLTWVGCVEKYDRDNCEVSICVHGTWNDDTNKLGPIVPRSGPRPFQKIFKVDQDEVRETLKEW